jgi:hypothetical protein
MLADLEQHTVASLPDAGLTLVRTVGSGGFRCGAVVSTFFKYRASESPKLGLRVFRVAPFLRSALPRSARSHLNRRCALAKHWHHHIVEVRHGVS